jgi:hypothetical protein
MADSKQTTAPTIQQVTNDFGIMLVDESAVPEAPREKDNNADLWKVVKVILTKNADQWAEVKKYVGNVNAAGQKASQINSGKSKSFPASNWQARSRKDETQSVLFLKYSATPTAEPSESANKPEASAAKG